jgi:hypothetical protein
MVEGAPRAEVMVSQASIASRRRTGLEFTALLLIPLSAHA